MYKRQAEEIPYEEETDTISLFGADLESEPLPEETAEDVLPVQHETCLLYTSNKGAVLIHGRRAPILGRVCMDQFMVDVTDIPDVKFMDEVVLIGRSGDGFIPVEELSEISGRFNYEFACDLGKRIPRVYL